MWCRRRASQASGLHWPASQLTRVMHGLELMAGRLWSPVACKLLLLYHRLKATPWRICACEGSCITRGLELCLQLLHGKSMFHLQQRAALRNGLITDHLLPEPGMLVVPGTVLHSILMAPVCLGARPVASTESIGCLMCLQMP